MRKGAVVGLAACVALAGCSTTDGPETAEATSSTVETTIAGDGPRGFQFGSGFLEFGDFDPDTLGDDIFNPCTEITPEEYAAAGFDEIIHEPEIDEAFGRGLSFCYYDEARSDGVVRGFSNNSVDREEIADQMELMTEFRSELIPELYVFAPPIGGEGTCYTQVDTIRGGFGSQAGGPAGRILREDACRIAVEDLENLFLTFGASP